MVLLFRMPDVSFPNNLIKIIGLLLKLKQPIDYEANDNQPVDIIFMLLASELAPNI